MLIGAQLATRDAVDATYAALTEAGYSALQAPYDTFWGSRMAIIADPEGNAVSLESPAEDGYRHWPPEVSPDL